MGHRLGLAVNIFQTDRAGYRPRCHQAGMDRLESVGPLPARCRFILSFYQVSNRTAINFLHIIIDLS